MEQWSPQVIVLLDKPTELCSETEKNSKIPPSHNKALPHQLHTHVFVFLCVQGTYDAKSQPLIIRLTIIRLCRFQLTIQ